MHVVLPGQPAAQTGGFIYDHQMVEALRARGIDVAVHSLAQGWPFPDDAGMRNADEQLQSLPDDALVLVDGLAFGAMPHLAKAHAARLRLVPLVHHPLAAETGLSVQDREKLEASERAALAQARHVIATSAFTAGALVDYGVTHDGVSVVPPGVVPAPPAAGGQGQALRLLCVATLIPRKGHDVLLNALAGLTDRAWELDLVGSEILNARHATQLRRLSSELGLDERVRFHGSVQGERLEALYHHADLFVLASHYEGYGMVLMEAVARGLPVVATAGGAVPYTLPERSGLLAPAGDIAGLRNCLARVLDDPEMRRRMAAGAHEARDNLPTWSDAAGRLLAALENIGS